MSDHDLGHLVTYIDQLMEQYLSARADTEKQGRDKQGRMINVLDADVEKLLDEGLYPPDDATSAPRMALLAIGETLGRVGGEALMKQVYDQYEAKFGAAKAMSLEARWDSAAGLWYA